MPHYFFHMRDGAQFLPDEDGSELHDLDAARSEALVAAAEILAGRIRAGRALGHPTFDIADHTGAVLLSVPFRASLYLD